MKIIMLGWELPPHNSGGLGIACYGLCKALTNDGLQIEFILPYSPDVQDESNNFMNVRGALPANVKQVVSYGNSYESYKYIYHDKKLDASWHDLFSHQQAYEYAIDQLDFDNDFDIIHAHDWLTFGAALKLKNKYKKPVVLHVHSIESDRSGGAIGNPRVRHIEGSSMQEADKVIAVSQHTKQQIIEQYAIEASKIEVVHNSITPWDYGQLSHLTNSYQVIYTLKQQGYKVLVNIGRLTIQKGLTNLLQAFKKASEHNKKLLLLIAGSGELKNELIELSADLGITRNVFFTDFVRGKRWSDAYSVGDLFVMPSVSEPFGLTPLESILHGTPALVSKQSGVAEVLNNVLKVDFWDVDKMASQIVNVTQHESFQDELIKNSLQEVRNMGWHTASKKTQEAYGKLVSLGVETL